MATPEEVAADLAAKRAAGGNETTSKLQQAFRAVRKKARGAANVAGKVTKSIIQETSGGLREFGRGLTGREATPAGGGPGKATGGAPKATGAQQAADRLRGRTGGVAGDAARAPGRPGIEVTQERLPVRGGTAARTVGGVARTGLKALGPAGLAAGTTADIATSPIGSLGTRFLKTFPGTAPAANIVEKGLRLARGESPLEAAVETGIGGLSAATGGLVPPTLAPGAERSPLDVTGDIASQTPLQLAGVGAPAQQPAGLRGAQFGDEGERVFTNADATAALSDRSPEAIAARRGTASVEENQAVIDRLLARNQGQRAEGLRAAAATPGAPGAPGAPGGRESSDLLNRLGRQAAGGGLASAFGALNVGGNVLRREAAERTRANEAQVAATDASNKLNLELTKIGAKSQVDRTKNLAKNAVGLVESVADAETPEAATNARSAIFQASATGQSPEADAAAANITADAIREISGPNTLLGALFNPFDAFFKGERGPGDVISALGQGGFNNEFQNAVGKLVHNRSTGMLQIANPDGSGFQDVGEFGRLPPEVREHLNTQGLRKIGEGQEITRGDPAVNDPTQPSF